MTSMYILTTDDPPRVLNISKGDISATDHPIHFMFRSRVGFSGSVNRMAVHPIGPNGYRNNDRTLLGVNFWGYSVQV